MGFRGCFDEYGELLLHSFTGAQREYLRNTMMRIFPILESVWNKNSYDRNVALGWAAERRVCSIPHFDAYFRFSIGAEVLPAVELDALIVKVHDSAFIAAEMRSAVLLAQPSGGTKVAVILDELARHAKQVDIKHIQPPLTGLFEVADEINIEADRSRGRSMGDNEKRPLQGIRSRVQLQISRALIYGCCWHLSLNNCCKR